MLGLKSAANCEIYCKYLFVCQPSVKLFVLYLYLYHFASFSLSAFRFVFLSVPLSLSLFIIQSISHYYSPYEFLSL